MLQILEGLERGGGKTEVKRLISVREAKTVELVWVMDMVRSLCGDINVQDRLLVALYQRLRDVRGELTQ